MSENESLSTTPASGRRVAVIGGGPGGLMTAYKLQERCGSSVDLTLYEASPRLGGKILTKHFASAPVSYEAGAAELYDYSHAGDDPLRELIEDLGLTVEPMTGTSVVIGDEVLHDLDDIGRVYGEAARQALLQFDARAKNWMTPQDFYDSDWGESNVDPLASRTFHDELARVPVEETRRFLRTLVHSDLATEPHRTSASYGLQNYLMNDPSYLRLYTIEGGIERLTQKLSDCIEARLFLRERVTRVERVKDNRLRISSRRDAQVRSEVYDYVVVALPNGYISSIDWAGETLAAAMHRHLVHHEYPAHYLRVSVLFREVFWQQHFQDTFLMLDAFGGCCLYDESSRNGCLTYGVLGWLLSGDAAMTAANQPDQTLIDMVLESLPSFLQHGRGLFVEGKVHRWIGAVNGLPAGSPVWDLEARHIPEPARPNLLMVGDYLFDSTLNGVLDSADYVTERLAESVAASSHVHGLEAAYTATS